MKNKIYTAQEAADFVGLLYSTFRNTVWRDTKKPDHKKQFPNAKKFGSAWQFEHDDLVKYKKYVKARSEINSSR